MPMKKVAIITLFENNFGNKLQNYALQQILKEMNCDVRTVIVNNGLRLHRIENKQDFLSKFNPKYIAKVISSRFKNKYPYKNQRDGVRKSIRLNRTSIPRKLEQRRKDAFRKNALQNIMIDEEPFVQNGENQVDDYDAYICGSDQIWNPSYTSTSSAYFLQFAPEHKRIAFAPSFGVSSIPSELYPLYKKWLNGIPYLSVREQRGAEIIKEITGREVPILPDPTLCLSKESWSDFERKPDYIKCETYVLTYFLGNETNKYRRFIEHYAAGKKIINLLDLRDPEYFATDPAEFVWLIHHAKAVFTDSFHGTVFSLIFHTPFIVFERIESGGMGMSSRIETLLKIFSMDDRWFSLGKAIDACDFSQIEKIIEREREKALVFIQKSLKSVEDAKSKNIINPYVLKKKSDCSGCAACVAACPAHCIKMKVDSEGFRYPFVDYNKCINCDKCKNICNESSRECPTKFNKAYIAWTENEKIRRNSSSGGMFSELSDGILKQGGHIYGAGFDDTFRVIHKCIQKKSDLKRLRGSKYVQSDIENCFEEIKTKLEKGIMIYFSGTPCQVDGLLSFLGKKYDNLYTQDIICHGVPSPKVWKAYITMMSAGSKIKNVSFRDKTYGWHYFSMKIETEDKKYIKRSDEDVYTRLFLENVILRPSCYNCHHKHLHRKADITIADCWSLDKFRVSIVDEDKGLSLVFANTDKGKSLLIETLAKKIEVPYDTAARSQAAMINSVKYNQNRELFFALAEEKGLKDVLRNWYGWDKPVILNRKVNYLKYRIKRRI